jgi:hypothetical protein
VNLLARVPRPLWRPIVATALIISGAIAYQLWSAAAGAAKIAADALQGPRIHVAIRVNIAPEAYHMARMQQAGRLVRTDARTYYIADARAGEVEALARAWWVSSVRRWDGQ